MVKNCLTKLNKDWKCYLYYQLSRFFFVAHFIFVLILSVFHLFSQILQFVLGIAKDCTFLTQNFNERPVIPNGSYKFINSEFMKKLKRYRASSIKCLKKKNFGSCANYKDCDIKLTSGICYEIPCGHRFCPDCYDEYCSIWSICPVCYVDYEDEEDQKPLSEKIDINALKQQDEASVSFSERKLFRKSTCLEAITVESCVVLCMMRFGSVIYRVFNTHFCVGCVSFCSCTSPIVIRRKFQD